jgi:hypothetical protein
MSHGVPRRGSWTLLRPLYPSLHASDELAMLALLDSHGFDLGEDGDTWEEVGPTVDGRVAFYLYGRESVVARPSMEQLAESFAELSAMAGLVPQQRVA